MNRHESAALDRHITGNYGEDQFKDDFHDADGIDGFKEDPVRHTCRWIGEGLDGEHWECMHSEDVPDCKPEVTFRTECHRSGCTAIAVDDVFCEAHQPGRCGHCDQDVSLNHDGTLRRHHGGDELDRATDGICSGSGSLPEASLQAQDDIATQGARDYLIGEGRG